MVVDHPNKLQGVEELDASSGTLSEEVLTGSGMEWILFRIPGVQSNDHDLLTAKASIACPRSLQAKVTRRQR